MKFKDKVVVITGGASGIGGATTRAFARQGAKVAFTYATSADEAAAIERDCKAQGQIALGFKADLTKPEAIVGVFAEVERRLGPVDVLFANAGGLLQRRRCVELHIGALERGDRDQPHQHLPRLPGGAPLHGAAAHRCDRHHVVARRL